jgi:hypothetical protein
MALVFLDLDGTLLENGRIVPGAKEAVKELKDNNHIVVIATGRNPNLLYGVDKELGIDNLVLANGSYVSYQGVLIKENFIRFSTVKRMMELADRLMFDLVVEYHDAYKSYRQDTDAAKKFSEIFNIEVPELDRTEYPDRKVYAMLLLDDKVVTEIKEEFSDLQFNKSNQYGYDVNLSGDLKAEGIQAMIDYLNYPIEDTYAIGDAFNDVSMLKKVRHGIAMGNAFDELKAVAEYVTTDVLDRGVYRALKHYKLI